MSAAPALSGWLLCSTSSAAFERSVICQAVTAPNAMTSRARTAPMTRSRPGSVVAAERSRSAPSAKAVRRGGPGGSCGTPHWPPPPAVARAGASGIVGVAGGAPLCCGCVTRPPPWSSVGRLRPERGSGHRCTAASIAAGTGIRTGLYTILFPDRSVCADARSRRCRAPPPLMNTRRACVRFPGVVPGLEPGVASARSGPAPARAPAPPRVRGPGPEGRRPGPVGP